MAESSRLQRRVSEGAGLEKAAGVERCPELVEGLGGSPSVVLDRCSPTNGRCRRLAGCPFLGLWLVTAFGSSRRPVRRCEKRLLGEQSC